MLKPLNFLVLAAGMLLGAPQAGLAQQQGLVLGFTTAKSGTWVSFTRRNEIALQMAVDEINKAGGVNGKPLVIKSFDTASKPEQAATAVRQFAENDGALAIIGPFSSGECRVAFPVGERLGIAQMAIASAAPGLAAPFKFAFRNTSDEGYLFERLLAVLKQRNIQMKTAAVAYASDEVVAKSLGEQVFPGLFKKQGVPIVQSVTFPIAAFDLSAQVSQLKAKPADVIGVGVTPEGLVVLAKEMKRQGVNARLLGGTQLADPNLPTRLGPDGNGTVFSATFFADADDPKVRTFRDEFMRRAKAAGETGDLRPSMYDSTTYSNVHIYAEAMRRAKVTGAPDRLAQERAAIRDALRALRNVDTIEGKLERFTDGGDALKTAYVIEIRDGQFHLLGTRGPD
jgi:branched-chain amino acid transport system substrate-binding protein